MGACASLAGGDRYRLVRGVPCEAKVWRLPPALGSRYPEYGEMPGFQERTADVGLAIQGGAMRSACMSLGTIAALDALGVLPRLRYLVGISGSSLVVAPFSFLPKRHSVAQFFGGVPQAPNTLTPQVVSNPEVGSWLKAQSDCFDSALATQALCNCLRADARGAATRGQRCPNCLAPRDATYSMRAYVELVSEPFLAPFDLFCPGSVMSAPEGTEAFQRALRAVQPTKAVVTPMRGDGPFPILGSSRLIEPDGKNSQWCPLEYTPLYIGTPIDLQDAPGGPVGGGSLESFGFNSPAPVLRPPARRAAADGEPVTVTPKTWVSLAQAMAVSTEDIYTHCLPCLLPAGPTCDAALGGSTTRVWSPMDVRSHSNELATVADGGPTDTCGLIACLRRGVPKVIVQCADAYALTPDVDVTERSWWASYFGVARASTLLGYGMTAEYMNKVSQVFDAVALQPLVGALKAKSRAGIPIVHELTLDVRENRYAGVPGGWKVQLIWIYGGATRAWLASLPPDTRRMVNTDPAFAHFPYTSSTAFYPPRLARMLAETTANNLIHGVSLDTLSTFFGGSWAPGLMCA